MNQSIVDQYNMSFRNQILVSELTGKKEIIKVVNTHNLYLASFLFDWYSASEIDEFLLPGVEEALANIGAEVENGSAIIYIFIYHNVVKFYNDDQDDAIYEVPTKDFKEIILNWKEFLLTPPFNGSTL